MLSGLTDVAPARRFVEDALACGVGELEVIDSSLRDGWTVQYRAALRAPSAPRALAITVQQCPAGKLAKAACRLRRQAAKYRPELLRFIAERPDMQVLVFPFPLDPGIAHLPEAADPAAMAERLATGCECQSVRDIGVLRYVPGKRCQFRYRMIRRNGTAGTVLGKTFRDSRNRCLFQATETVARLFFDFGDPELAAPRALAYLEGLEMLVQEWLPGRTLHDLLNAREATREHFVSAARSIAVLHGGAMTPARSHGIEDEIEVIGRAHRTLEIAGCHEPGYGLVLERIRKQAEAVGAGWRVPVHRDFYDKQLLIDGRRTALIDLDTLAHGPAEIDLANFVAHVRLRSLQGLIDGQEAAVLESAFLDEYARRCPRPIDTGLFQFFLTATWFRHACIYRVRRNGNNLGPRLLRMADTAACGHL